METVRRKQKKEFFTFLFFIFAMAMLFVFPLNLYHPASALELASEENERYAIQINELGCELTDYEIHVDLWHLSITGSYTVLLNNSGDTDVSIRWNDGSGDGDTSQEGNEMIIPAKTVKKYSINFSFRLLSRDFSYEYEESICLANHKITQISTRKCEDARYKMRDESQTCIRHPVSDIIFLC